MKKLSSIFYLWLGFGLSLLTLLMINVPIASYDGGFTLAPKSMFFGDGYYGGAWLAFVGYMLVLVGGLISMVIALPFVQPTYKLERVLLIVAASLTFVGLILVALITVEYKMANGQYMNLDYLHVGWYLSMVFGLGAMAMELIALKLDW